jgi:hypothetical protein
MVLACIFLAEGVSGWLVTVRCIKKSTGTHTLDKTFYQS